MRRLVRFASLGLFASVDPMDLFHGGIEFVGGVGTRAADIVSRVSLDWYSIVCVGLAVWFAASLIVGGVWAGCGLLLGPAEDEELLRFVRERSMRTLDPR